MDTPIFEQARAELPDAPICRICGTVDIAIGIGHDICSQCWMCNRDEPSEWLKWHCADCGEFIDGLDRHQVVTEHQLERYKYGTDGRRYEYVYYCREHYQLHAA